MLYNKYIYQYNNKYINLLGGMAFPFKCKFNFNLNLIFLKTGDCDLGAC